ncbi:ERO1-like protein beta [Nymphon striatum]|nr:ERO1-like protein beta [Nymphon striatum]
MTKLPETFPEVHRHFSQGLHVVRRSDRLWAGLSADLVIEQVLMRSMKTSGGLTRGRGMTEVQRVVWLLSHPLCSEVNNAMQQLTGVNYNTSEQHKDVTKSRQEKDMTDTCQLLEFLEPRNPFSDNKSLRNIATGVNADDRVNADNARDVGDKILTSMVDKHVLEYTFKKTNQAVTMSTSVVKINNEAIHIDSQLLFQRLITAGTRADQLQDIFKFELCSYPPAIFEAKHVMRPANKPALADALWTLMPEDVAEPIGDSCQYVLDGGSLLHRIPWSSGTTYSHICRQYTDYVTRKYGRAVIVFDGYEEDLSTKDSAQQRRSCGRVGPTVEFTSDMVMKSKKDEFLSNKHNKQHFINTLSERLREAGCRTCHATGDADFLIAQTAVGCADSGETILVGDDTDLLVLLCYHVKDDSDNIFFRPEPKAGTKKSPRCWDIKALQRILGRNVCNYLLLAHAMLGCDTTSRVFGFGKGVAIKHMRNDTDFKSHADVFLDEDATQSEIADAGEKYLVSILKGDPEETLDQLRLQRFHQKVATNKNAVQPETLPPTSAATKYHSLRVYYQVQVWKGVTNISPQGYGWTVVDGKLIPFQCDLDVAPKMLLEVVRCNCKAGCETQRCSCRKAGLDCSTGCGHEETWEEFEKWKVYDDSTSAFCQIDDGMKYVDLLLNPERYTGYRGPSAHRIWNTIYKENCFQPEKSLGPFISSESVKAINSLANPTWGLNLNEFNQRFDPKETVGEGPQRLKNLYFLYLLELRALAKASQYLENFEYYTGSESDSDIRIAVKELLDVVKLFPNHFDETVMFSGNTKEASKLKTQGLGTAFKILFSDYNKKALSKRKVGLTLRRAEIVSLFNAFGRLSNSIYELENIRKLHK